VAFADTLHQTRLGRVAPLDLETSSSDFEHPGAPPLSSEEEERERSDSVAVRVYVPKHASPHPHLILTESHLILTSSSPHPHLILILTPSSPILTSSSPHPHLMLTHSRSRYVPKHVLTKYAGQVNEYLEEINQGAHAGRVIEALQGEFLSLSLSLSLSL
jgi:hypothetical protein